MNKRETFGSRLGFVLVSAGCAIGLGNVWKFPYITGRYGGAAFILIYLLFLAILGLPILTCEFAVGRASRLGIAGAFDKLEPKGSKWHIYKWAGISGNFLLMMFYTMVSGWMVYYAYRYIIGDLMALDNAGVEAAFGNMLSSPGTLTMWMFIALTISCTVCLSGLQKGIEKITKVMMLVLIGLMVALAVHTFFLGGKGPAEGLKFYLVPDFKRMYNAGIGNVVFAAMSQAFFTLSIGIGSMQIFGSYMQKENTLIKESVTVIALDTFVALVAGFIVIPACFAFGTTSESLQAGPPLLFISLPNVFNSMNPVVGRIVGLLFFVFMSFAALSTVIAVVENIVAFFMDQWNWSRKKATIITYFLLLVLSMPAILGFNVLSNIRPFGGETGIMDLEDFIVSYNLLPIGSLLFVMFCTRKTGWGWENFKQEADEGNGAKIPNWLRVYMKYILPVIIIGVYLKGYYDFFVITPEKTEKFGMTPVFAGLDKKGICWMLFAFVIVAFTIYISSAKSKKKEN